MALHVLVTVSLSVTLTAVSDADSVSAVTVTHCDVLLQMSYYRSSRLHIPCTYPGINLGGIYVAL